MKLSPSILRVRKFRSILCLSIAAIGAVGLLWFAGTLLIAQTAQMGQMAPPDPNAPLPSPAATAEAAIGGGTIDIRYNTPQMRGRKIMGELVPYDAVWRTGANPATTIITSVPLTFGTLLVPAGTHTLYSLPSTGTWQLIVNNQTGQWGTEYHQEQDLGRVPMKAKPMAASQEAMSLSFENTTAVSTELHVRWETTDRFITIMAVQADPGMKKQ